MKGYVKFIGGAPVYAMKRQIKNNEVISFDDLYSVLGISSGVKAEDSVGFANWLRKNKFVNGNWWSVVSGPEPAIKKENIVEEYIISPEPVVETVEEVVEVEQPIEEVIEPVVEEVVEKVVEEEQPVKEVIKEAVKEKVNSNVIDRVVEGGSIKKITVKDIVDLKVSEAKAFISKIEDLNLLMGALKKAERMSKRATLCKALRYRISELKL